jgi:hypothetical protein
VSRARNRRRRRTAANRAWKSVSSTGRPGVWVTPHHTHPVAAKTTVTKR